MELRLPLEIFPGREAACRAVFGTWGFCPNDARKNCPFVLTSFTGWSSERCPGIGFLSRGDREIGVLRKIGRASCRGKSVDLGGRRIIKKKKKKRLKGQKKRNDIKDIQLKETEK